MAEKDRRRSRKTADQRSVGRSYPLRSPDRRRRDPIWIYGLHAVEAALANPRRKVLRVVATPNAIARLDAAGAGFPTRPEPTTPRVIDRMVGTGAVHQGVAIEVMPLEPVLLSEIAGARFVLALDQVTDPHNVGAIMRSSLAFGCDALITTRRHAPAETGVLAKAASGAFDRLTIVEVQNLARALEDLKGRGFTRIGLDGNAESNLEGVATGDRVALVLGAEGKGLRRLTRDTCDVVACLPVPGPLATLNVSNAAVLALYIAHSRLGGQREGLGS